MVKAPDGQPGSLRFVPVLSLTSCFALGKPDILYQCKNGNLKWHTFVTDKFSKPNNSL